MCYYCRVYEASTECDVGGTIEHYQTYSTDWCMLIDGGKAQQYQCAEDGTTLLLSILEE